MDIIHSDTVVRVDPDSPPDYNRDNPLARLFHLIEDIRLAAEREHYVADSLQYLIPFEHLEMYGPSPPAQDVLDPTLQDSKTDFQKQNVRKFLTADTYLVRGWITVNGWTGPFLRLSYRGGPDSELSSMADHELGERIKLWLKVGDRASDTTLSVPYNPITDRYEIELWGYPSDDLRGQLDRRGQQAMDLGELQRRPDLVRGSLSDFDRETLDDQYVMELFPDHSMHPVRPLHIEAAWTDDTERIWDSKFGANYQYEFNMLLRGWDHFLGVGISPTPHGGVGFLEFRNLTSNYGRYMGSGDLGRQLEPWNFDANGSKDHSNRKEDFFAVDYMDLHILKAQCGIGLHRHRDNQEVFLMMNGEGLMVIGDWCKMPRRERCFEVRTLRSGHFAMLKGGHLHGLLNPSRDDISLFMFGGYD